MHAIQPLLFARQDSGSACVECPVPVPCNCTPDQDCVVINRNCQECSVTKCVPRKPVTKKSGGVSAGALAGGIVGAVIVLAVALSIFFWYRRKSRLNKLLGEGEVKRDKPAPVEDVLNRPDPTEKLSVISSRPPSAQQPDPESHGTTIPSPSHRPDVNPFEDSNSIQTTRTEGPNVIPIALDRSKPETDTLPSTTSSGPTRPSRSPDLNLNLDHVNVSHDNLRVPYASSTISGLSGLSGRSRNSYMSGASYSSDFLNEAPVIVTANKGAVRQVLNVVKAEVVNAGTLTPGSDAAKPPTFNSRPIITSPLAANSFGPSDVVKEVDESKEASDPFDDVHSTTAQGSTSPAVPAFPPTPRSESGTSNWVPDGPILPWARSEDSRPSSISTQAGSEVNIGSAMRVNVGLSNLASPTSATVASRSTYRTTMGRLVSPTSAGSAQSENGVLQQQQLSAFAQAQAQTESFSKRASGSSVVSAASTRADSILEAFPFVPPSPISDRPVRPPVSPLGKQSFTAPASPLARAHSQSMSRGSQQPQYGQPVLIVAPPSPMKQQAFGEDSPTTGYIDPSRDEDGDLPAPPDRRTLGLSTGSQLSTTSTGLGSFPFQIDSGARTGSMTGSSGSIPVDTTSDDNRNSEIVPDGEGPKQSTRLEGRQRASLDTLALTSDLASYPLDFERGSAPPTPNLNA